MDLNMNLIENVIRDTKDAIMDVYILLTVEKADENNTPQQNSSVYKQTFIKKKDIVDVMDSTLLSLTESQVDYSTASDYIKVLEDRTRKTKLRWIKKDIDSHGPLDKEMELIRSMYSLVSNDDEKFFKVTSSNNPTEYRNHLLELLTQYSNNHLSILGEYRYIQSKMEWQILNALKNDVEYLYYKKTVESVTSKKREMYEVPRELANYPMDTTNSKIPVDMATMEKAKRGDILYVDLDVNEFSGIVFKSRYDVSMFKDQTVSLSINRLGKLDQDIISYLLQIRNEDFYRTREVITTIGDIASNIPRSTSGYTYMLIRESLFRLQYLTIIAVTSELKGFSLKLLDNVDIIPIDNKDTVRVLFNEDVVQQAANEQTMLMYKDIVDGFEYDMSTPLMLNLQRERVGAFSKGENTLRTTYNNFRRYLFLKDNRKARNIKKIMEALDEIVNSGILLKSYTRHRDEFVFVFCPITEKEKQDLFRGVPLKDLGKNIIQLDNMEYQLTLEDALTTE